MKTLKLVNVFVVVMVLAAFLPVNEVSAAITISSNTTISSNATWTEDMVVTNGATLTIAAGVTVTVNCTDSPLLPRYATEKDPEKIELIIENGTLIADQVTFQGASTGSCWYGIEVLDNGYAQITHSTIRDARVGITVDKSSAVITENTIHGIWGKPNAADLNHRDARGIQVVDGDEGITILNNTITGVQGAAAPDDILPLAGGVAYGIVVTRTNNITLQGNQISNITGGNAGDWSTDASDGADGADSYDYDHPTPTSGGNGANGGAGGPGGNAFGIFAQSTDGKSVVMFNNSVTNIIGGNGSRGQLGGDGGAGGAADYQPIVQEANDTPINGYAGGAGGNGGAGGTGGNGGIAHGIYASNVTASISSNQVTGMLGGNAGVGVPGGSGGAGGLGGKGSNSFYDLNPAEVLAAGYGGPGGAGGNAGATGNSGQGGSAIGVYFNSGSLLDFSENTILNVTGRMGALGNMGASGGNGGNGGDGGNGYFNNQLGGGGGNGGPAGRGGRAGDGGGAGAAYGVWVNNAPIASMDSNSISSVVANIGLVAGDGGQGGSGGTGGKVTQYPNVDDPNVKGGTGGAGGAAGNGGNGGRAGLAYGICITQARGATTAVNNLVFDVYAAFGGDGGDGGAGGSGGRGGSGDPSIGETQPGGAGGAGGAAGSGGHGANNVPDLTMANVSGVYLSSSSSLGASWLVTNNTIANLSSFNDSNPLKGLKGTPGTGGAGGAGNPAGAPGAAGAAGGDGNPGVKGQTGAYYSGPYVTSNLYNNILAFIVTAPLTNSVGVFKAPDGSVSGFRYGDLFGWHKNLGDAIAGIDQAGSISADPLFVDFGSGNFHLSAESPCKDMGLNTAPGVPVDDLEGAARPQGAGVDIGAFEGSGAGAFGIFLPLIVR